MVELTNEDDFVIVRGVAWNLSRVPEDQLQQAIQMLSVYPPDAFTEEDRKHPVEVLPDGIYWAADDRFAEFCKRVYLRERYSIDKYGRMDWLSRWGFRWLGISLDEFRVLFG